MLTGGNPSFRLLYNKEAHKLEVVQALDVVFKRGCATRREKAVEVAFLLYGYD